MNIIFSIISILLSSLFVAYGLSLTTGLNNSLWLFCFWLTSILYGGVGFYCLYLALRKGVASAVKMLKYVSLVYLFIFIVASLDVGRISGQELLLIIIVGILLLINWFMVKKIISRSINA